MAVSLPDLRGGAVKALREILPGAPGIVVALASELPKSHRGAGVGYCGKDLDVAIRPHIGFKGRAAAMVIEDAVLLENQQAHAIARGLDSPTPAMLRGAFLETVAHEIGHIITNRWIPSPDDPEPAAPTITLRVEKLCEAGPDTRTGADLIVPWANHCGRWMRVYFHVCHRLAAVLNMPICPSTDPFHRVSSARKYQLALGDEPAALAGVALGEIGGIGPPESFIKQWQTDVSNWWMGLSHPTDENTAMLFAWRNLFTP